MNYVQRSILVERMRQSIVLLERRVEAMQILVYGRVKTTFYSTYKGTRDRLVNGEQTLAPLRQRFVEEYPKDLNATRAAERAGYAKASAHVSGCNLLKDKRIIKALRKEFSKLTRRNRIEQDRVAKELAALAYSNIKTFCKWNAAGLILIDSDQVSDRDSICIKEIKETTGPKSTTISIKLHDKLTALNTLAKYVGMLDGEKGKTETEEQKKDRMQSFVRQMFGSIPGSKAAPQEDVPENVKQFESKLIQLESRQ